MISDFISGFIFE